MNASASVSSGSNGRYLSYYIGRDDDENEKGELQGIWMGQLAAEMRLEGKIERNSKALDSLVIGKDPNTGEVLRKGALTTKTYTDKQTGEQKEYKPTNYVDITFSAPKDYSILWALSSKEQQQQLEQIHRAAVLTAFDKIQENSYRRDSKGTYKADIVAGAFQHSTSRENDPNLHTHLWIGNIGKSADGKTGALDIKKLLGNGALHEYGAIFKAELRHGLKNLGFETKEVQLKKGSAFNITNVGITDTMRQHFGKRSKQIKADQAEHPEKSKQQSTLDTRKKKDERVDRQACFKRWKAEGTKLGYDLKKLEVQKTKEVEKKEAAAVAAVAKDKPKSPEKNSSESKVRRFEVDREKEKLKQELGQKVLHSLHRKEAFSVIKSRDVQNRVFNLSGGEFDSKELKSIAEQFTKKHLHQIGSAPARWDRKADKPLHLKVHANRSKILRQVSHEVKFQFSSRYRDRLQALSERRESIRAKHDRHSKPNRLYTLSQKSRSHVERDSVYSIVRSKLSKPLQKLLPQGKALTYQYREKQYQKSRRKFEQRSRDFKRKVFYLYLTNKISHKQYKKLNQPLKEEKSKLVVNLKWLLSGKMTKRQRDYLIKKIDRRSAKTEAIAEKNKKHFVPRFTISTGVTRTHIQITKPSEQQQEQQKQPEITPTQSRSKKR